MFACSQSVRSFSGWKVLRQLRRVSARLAEADFVSSGFALSGLAVLLLATALPCFAEERILDYHADVTIHPDATLTVTETIRVMAEGNQIRRGIYRDFPTRYRDHRGNHFRVDFQVEGVTRDGSPEPWHTEAQRNGVRVYAGSGDVLLAPGEHRYTISYRTDRQLGYFETFDELYWNVTGTGWAFPIEHASARIQLPARVEETELRFASYTGAQGATSTNARVSGVERQAVSFETTAPLGPYEGLTVAVGWPKGLVREPSRSERVQLFFRDNGGTFVLLLGVLAALAWYLTVWHWKGRDPRKGVIFPRFEPPKGLSPAACRYVRKMGLDQRAMTAAVVSLGVKGWLEIEESSGDFTLRRREAFKRQDPSPGEAAVLAALLPTGTNHLQLKVENYAALQQASAGLNKALAREHRGRMFNTNGAWALPGLAISILAGVLAAQLPGSLLAWVAYVPASFAMLIVFVFLLRAHTPAGRQVLDEIEGFHMYLETAEQDRLERMASPTLTPEVFEAFLPYAFALGVENSWCQRFARQFPELVDQDGGYPLAWYHGNLTGAHAFGSFSGQLSEGLSSAIASASTPPGSSSGSGGGGSSGGGGGGGGGGGW